MAKKKPRQQQQVPVVVIRKKTRQVSVPAVETISTTAPRSASSRQESNTLKPEANTTSASSSSPPSEFRERRPRPQRDGDQRQRRKPRLKRSSPEETKKNMELLEKWVYLEHDSPYFLKKIVKVDECTNILQLKYFQRAVGMIKGKLLSYDAEKHVGQLEIDGHVVPCKDRRYPWVRKKNAFENLIGEEYYFSFWPSWDFSFSHKQLSHKNGVPLSFLKISSKRDEPPALAAVEVIGKLTRVYPKFFEVMLWSQSLRREVYIYVQGEYPYPDEQGQFVWVRANFDPVSMHIVLEEAEALAFLSDEEAAEILKKVEVEQAPEEAAKENAEEATSASS